MTDETTPPPHHVEPEFSYPIDVAALPPAGRTYSITASAEECVRVAKRLDLQKVDTLSAKLEINMAAGGQIAVTGSVSAKVTQSCVVSLAPVAAVIEESIEAAFITEERAVKDKAKREKAKLRKPKEDDEDIVDPEADEPPEVALANRIDLGEVVVVHLALALDPYPRAPGAAFDPKAWGLEPEKPEIAPTASPFAALAKLKKTAKNEDGA